MSRSSLDASFDGLEKNLTLLITDNDYPGIKIMYLLRISNINNLFLLKQLYITSIYTCFQLSYSYPFSTAQSAVSYVGTSNVALSVTEGNLAAFKFEYILSPYLKV